jgi:hypothetical protein
MSGWCPSLLVCVWCVEWRWCVLLPVRPVQWCSPCPVHPGAVLISTAIMSCYCSLPGVWRVAVHVSVCAVRVVGYPSLAPPSRWWWVGPSWMVGWHGETGWHDGGRVAVLLTPRLVCGVPLSVCMVVSLNGGRGVLCCPCLWVGSPPFVLSLSLLRCPALLRVFSCLVFCVWCSG